MLRSGLRPCGHTQRLVCQHEYRAFPPTLLHDMAYRGVSTVGANGAPCPGTIRRATARILARLV